MFVRRYFVRLGLLIAVSVTCTVSVPGAARAAEEGADDYEVMPLQPWMLGDSPQDKKRRNDLDIRAQAILRGSESFADQATKDFLQTYYARYYFALLTHPKNIGDWPKSRVSLARTLAAPNLQEPPLLEVHDFLVELIYQTMLPLIRGNYHPAVRSNAMLLLGNLNSQDAVFIGDKRRPPVPLIQSLRIMLDELANPEQIDGVRAAALVGILRHVEIDRQLADQPGGQRRLVGNNAETMIIEALIKRIDEKEAPEGRSQQGHDWMRRRAVEILGYLGSPGQNNSVVTALDGILSDNRALVALRCSAAEALGRLQFPANTKIDVTDIARKLATVAVFACQKELQRVEEQEAREAKEAMPRAGMGYAMESGYGGPEYGGMMGGDGMMGGMPMMSEMPGYDMMPGGMPGMGMPDMGMPGGRPAAKFNPLGYRIRLTRRRIAHEMLLVKRGLLGPDATLRPGPSAAAKTASSKAGLSALAQANADQTAIENAVNGIDAIIRVVEQSTFNEMKALVTELRARVRQMEDQCGIVVELPDEQVPGATPDALLSSPLELPEGVPGLEMPAVPEEAPEAKPAEEPVAPKPDTPPKDAPPADAPAPADAPPDVPMPPDVPAPAAPEAPKG